MSTRPIRNILAGLVLAALPLASFAFVSVGISVNVAPPELPVYVQPPIPEAGYIWTPGYWAYNESDYYWVPGTWVAAPSPGLLWTPGYWGWGNGGYLWHGGYWGPHVGFYGGVNYGYGYGGSGFEGGYWRGGNFFYNRSVANIGGDVHVTNVYNKTVINNVTVNRVSFNGGTGGIAARPTSSERLAERDHHVEVTSVQRDHEHQAANNRELRASVNGGRPAIAATARPGAFSGKGVVAARSAGGPAHGSDTHAIRTDRPATARTEGAGTTHAAQTHVTQPGAQHNDRPQLEHSSGNPARVAPPNPAVAAHPAGSVHPAGAAHPEAGRGPGPGQPRAEVHANPGQPHPQAHGQPEGREHEEAHPRR
jgi:hypothetical protein